jgi:uncharacterized protein YuzE
VAIDRSGRVEIVFSEAERIDQKEVECVLDLDEFGELIGIEILPFEEQLGARPPMNTRDGFPRWSYDPMADGFYVRLKDHLARKQESAKGRAAIDSQGAVVGLSVLAAE